MTRTEFFQSHNIDAVREFVRQELCEKNHLEKDAFHMAERLLTRRGEPCGLYFCIYGPRSVRLTAVWDLARRSVFFYDSLGRRIGCAPPPSLVDG
ncbi:MAG: hypothetical protein KatS3mg111_3028 [Pirellulaceae bacterium]|nr:MAG: hypothetical protein KatS3mg111_3028 [Pirellulaceae bacterium]